MPVLVMSDTTEWLERVDAGTLKLVGMDEEMIYKTFKMLLENPIEYEKMSYVCNPYSDGYACEHVCRIFMKVKNTSFGCLIDSPVKLGMNNIN